MHPTAPLVSLTINHYNGGKAIRSNYSTGGVACQERIACPPDYQGGHTMAKKSKWDWLRPDYDLTDDYADLLDAEPDYAAIMAELAGCSMVAWEQDSNSIDDNGADTGDGCNVDAYCYN